MSAARLTRLVLASFAFLALVSAARAEPVELPGGAKLDNVDFERHIMGLLGRMGCSAGACHGSFQGKGGLYLSLFGYSPEKDYLSFTRDGMGRRLNLVNPDQSLVLLKASGQVSHGGGKRFDKGSWQYNVFREWIAQGAKWTPGSGKVTKIQVVPGEHLFAKPGESVQLKVMAEFADGSKADLTSFTDFRINDDYVAEISSGGQVKGVRPGDTTVVASYRGNVLAARALIPATAEAGFKYPKTPEVNYIDREVFAKLKKLNIVPSDLSTDSEFLRRVYIDTIGRVPTPDEARAFLANTDPDKRTKKIDELLSDPMHAALWATKFSDITGNNVDVMEQPVNLRPKRSKQWHDWLRKRFADNVPYDQLVKGVLTSSSRDGLEPDEWVKQTAAVDEQLSKGFDTDYANRASLDLFWRRGNGNLNNFTLEQMGEQTAAAFLGIRLECAQCHKHPFDRWTQADYRAYANVFSQVKFGTSPEAKAAIDKINAERREANQGRNNNQLNQMREIYASNDRLRTLPHPETNGSLKAKALGGPEIESEGDFRERLFQWMVQPDNPFFARSFVNRLWGHYFGIGLVDPVDNFSVANPPSNEKLLDALAKDFVESKFDIRRLERTILLSRTYQLSAMPNQTNIHDKSNYSRAYVRRLMAEVMVDVLNTALDVTENYGNDVPSGIRAIEIAPNRLGNQNTDLAYIFRIFGRPTRTVSCECERPTEPALPQTLYLMTDQNLLRKITNGRLKKLLADKKSDEGVVEELFLATLSRFPNDKEKGWATEHVQKKGDRQAAFVDVVWALINTREFVLNH